ncbi:glycosyltransferase family 2 protein [Borrelia sp. P9F1]|uniref:glycosyltransferase family 2 protein n=1 Tax=Borrelia sp. P9F1 TaxID=3058374 RepID=UPI0026480B55|nr:glycosyltransferase family 2 protein [Borrelia sp. P9F1]WKC58124.1 glycosyltransferase family 2 protein [Borrelia sp. P9F1]
MEDVMHKYKVSVIICFFNSEKTLELIIKDAVNQTLRDKEIILVNDGSYDNSLQIAQKYADRYDFIKIVNQKNMGIAVSRNNGFEKAQGEYIVYWDSDDSVESTMLEVLYNRAKADNSDVVCSQFYIYFLARGIKRKSLLPFPNYPITGKEAFENLLSTVFASFSRRNFVVGTLWDKLIRRDLISDHGIKLHDVVLEDIVFLVHVFLKSVKVSFVNNYFYTNFQRMGSASSSISVISRAGGTLEAIEALLKNEKIFEKYLQLYKKFYLQLYYFISFKQIYIVVWNIKDRPVYKAYKSKLISVLNEIKGHEEFRECYSSLKNSSGLNEIQILPRVMLKVWDASSVFYVNFAIFIYRVFLKN